ncbi:MAG: crossover junction endodeoxyribonuclease RuvC [Verrucomicrobia bacterium]|nr:crossover junction endodeoxyribonuclease RuvC [Verrucomicrobiota bacterium]
MQQRLRGPRRAPAAVLEPTGTGRPAAAAVLLGVDPSLRGTGYGVIQTSRGGARWLAHGVVRCPAGWDRSRCLLEIATALRAVVQSQRPTVCVIESLFYAQNYQTALLMGEARGACLVAVAEAGAHGLRAGAAPGEAGDRRLRGGAEGGGGADGAAAVGSGRAAAGDAADALALALAYAQEQGRYALSAPKRI